jgi:hypothetical protein
MSDILAGRATLWRRSKNSHAAAFSAILRWRAGLGDPILYVTQRRAGIRRFFPAQLDTFALGSLTAAR